MCPVLPDAAASAICRKKLIQAADLVLDAGPLKGGTGSTVLDITCDPPQAIRQGRIPLDMIRQVLAP
jgi:L-threonylcarbamoyladenylate synthase